MNEHSGETVEIRSAHPDDAQILTRLAQLDSAPVPPAPMLLAFEDGELRAALSVATGVAIADPFSHTARLVELLRIRAAAPRHRSRFRSPVLRRLPMAWRPRALER